MADLEIRAPDGRAIEALREHALPARIPPELATDPMGRDALSDGGLAALRAYGAPAEHVLDALHDYWLDRRRGRSFEPGLARLAWLRTAERLLTMHRDPPLRVMDAFDEAFSGLTLAKDEADATTADWTLLREAMIEGASAALRVAAKRPSAHHGATMAATSVVAVWPHAFEETFGALFDAPDAAGVDVALLYLSTVAYPSDAHPLFDRPGRPWSRFGAEHGCRWRVPAPERLAACLATEPLRAWLTAYEERPDARWPTIAEEIRVLQLDTSFARRRELLLRNLVEPDPPAEWDDELGIA